MFYDGHCGLCHRAVRFVLARDPDGKAFRFAPLGGPTFAALVPQAARERLPDSLVVLTVSGELRLRSDAVLFIGDRLGGLWRILARSAGLIPQRLRDDWYDFVAQRRRRWFRASSDVCPVVDDALRRRFEP